MKKLYGVVTALLTPARTDAEIDCDEAVRLARFAADGGVNGLFVGGTNGEGIKYSTTQRAKLAQAIVENVDHSRTMVCIHTGAARLEDTIELTQQAHAVGADCAAVVSPSFLSYDEDELYDYYAAVLESTPRDFPVYLYNIPQRTGNDISPAVCRRLNRRYDNLVGIKYSFNDLVRTQQYLEIDGFSVLHGWDVYQLQYLTLGCDGIVSGLSGVCPVPFVKLRECWLKNDIAGAQAWQAVCQEVGKVYCGGNIAVMKQAMRLAGYRFTGKDHFTEEKDLLCLKQGLERLDARIRDLLTR